MMASVCTFIACVLVAGAAFLFVFHRDYHAGVLGTSGLAFICIAAASRALSIAEAGFEARVTPQGVMLWIGLALFLGRQAYRFLARWRSCSDWHGPPRHVTPGRFT